MLTKYSGKEITWIDLENPTADDIKALREEYKIPAAWGKDLTAPSERAKIDAQKKSFYAVLHYPNHPSQNKELTDIEIDYIVGPDFVITAHYTSIDTFTDFIKKTKGKFKGETSTELFLELNNQLYRGLRKELEPMRKEIKKTETAIFGGNEFHMVKELSHLAFYDDGIFHLPPCIGSYHPWPPQCASYSTN